MWCRAVIGSAATSSGHPVSIAMANGTAAPSGTTVLLGFSNNTFGLGSYPVSTPLVDWGTCDRMMPCLYRT